MSLRNCPFDALVSDHRGLTCAMNLAWAEGVIDGLGAAASAELSPERGRCCVVFRQDFGDHPAAYNALMARDRSRLDDDGSPPDPVK